MTITQWMGTVTPRMPKDQSIRRNIFLLYLNDEELACMCRQIESRDKTQKDCVVSDEMKRELEIRKNEATV